MSKPAVRLGDLCTGHGCYPPRESISGSPNVFMNGKPVVRVGDLWNVHSCNSSHAGTQITGSNTVFCNGLPVARIGDNISCGSQNMLGSPDVFVGD